MLLLIRISINEHMAGWMPIIVGEGEISLYEMLGKIL